MNRRKFIGTVVGAMLAPKVDLSSVAAMVDPLAGYSLVETTGIRGYFQNGAFVRVYERLWHPDAVVINNEWFEAPVEIEVWMNPEKKVACVIRERISGLVVVSENCG